LTVLAPLERIRKRRKGEKKALPKKGGMGPTVLIMSTADRGRREERREKLHKKERGKKKKKKRRRESPPP